MDAVLRLLLRFILVPLGYLAAVIVGACVILFGSWKSGTHDAERTIPTRRVPGCSAFARCRADPAGGAARHDVAAGVRSAS